MPGGGKSTVGKEVARRLGVSFIDCDKEIERRAGRSISDLFEDQGESAFRDLEAQVLTSIVECRDSVIATGGGAVLRAENRLLLRSRTRCIYLSASPEFLWQRLRRDRRRPLLQVPDPQARLKQMSAEREPLYRETASIVIPVDRLPLHRVVAQVMQQLQSIP
jgi:shikimate kinase